VAGAAAVTWIIQSILYTMTPTDPVSFGGVALFDDDRRAGQLHSGPPGDGRGSHCGAQERLRPGYHSGSSCNSICHS
jgi:hypothetical protein